MQHHLDKVQYHQRLAERYPSTRLHHAGLAAYHYALWDSLATGKSLLPLITDGAALVVTRKIEKPRVDVSYPYADGLKDLGLQYRLNRTLINKIHQMLKDQFRDASNLTIQGGYEVKLNASGLLSFYFNHSSMVLGSAHGMSAADSVSFAADSAEPLTLKQLFRTDTAYIKPLDEEIRRQMKKREIPLIRGFRGIRSDNGFYLTPKALVLYFQTYEYTPYVYGIPEFPIPYGALTGVLDYTGPLRALLQ
jgi:hypothetical protein